MPAPSPSFPDTTRRDWTVDEVCALPDIGVRYEVIDGELLVTPAPSLLHQAAVLELVLLLAPYAQQHGLDIFVAPTAVRGGPRSEVQPDLLVLPRLSTRAARFISDIGLLRLAIEVLSPSSEEADRSTKRLLYQSKGVPEYWIVDPDTRQVERWRPADVRPEPLTGSLRWAPLASADPLVIDLPAYFRKVYGE